MLDEAQKQYEATFILNPNLEKDELDSLEKEIEKDIRKLGGSLKSKKEPNKRNLAYPW